MYLEGAKTIPDAVENLRKGIALGGLDTFNCVSTTVDDRKPVVPFMAIKEHREQVNTKDTIRVVAESIQDSIYENNKTIMRQLDKIGDRIANVVEDFQREQSSRNNRNRYRNRSNSRDRDNSGDSYKNRSRDRGRSNSRKVETTDRDLIQVKDTMTKRISVITATEQVIQHMNVLNLRTI